MASVVALASAKASEKPAMTRYGDASRGEGERKKPEAMNLLADARSPLDPVP